LQGILHGLRKLSNNLNRLSVPHMLIGGQALPAYGRIRASQDVDLAIAINHPALTKLHQKLIQLGYTLPAEPDPNAPLFVLIDLKTQFEAEIWTRPDGVFFDKELLRRRVKVKPFPSSSFVMFVIGPEDFIVNKLARKDRGTQDEQDIVSVLRKQMNKLDYEYLAERAQRANVTELLQEITNVSGTRPQREET